MGHVQKNIAKFYSHLNEFRNAEKYSDVTIVCEGRKFPCHRVALAAASLYFDAMFSSQMRESFAECISLPDVKAKAFEEVLRFIYTGDAVINSDNVYSLIVASDFLDIHNMEDLCTQYIKRGLPCKSILDILSYADAAKKYSLVNVLVNHVTKYLRLFLKSEEFLKIPFWFFDRVLSNPKCIAKFQLQPCADDILKNAIIRWIEHSQEHRSQYLTKFIELRHFREAFCTNLKLTGTDAGTGTTQVGKIVSFDSLISSNRNLLHAFVNYRDIGVSFYGPRNLVKVFEIGEDFDSFAACEVPQPHENLRNCISIGNTLYCFSHYWSGQKVKHKLYACTSIEMGSRTCLRSPYCDSYCLDICGMQSNIVLYGKNKKTDNILLYRTELDEWFAVSPNMVIGKRRACITVCDYDQRLYVIGGTNDQSEFTPTNSVQAYDFRAGQWQILPRTINKRSAAACCSLNGRVYVSGGVYTKTCEVYNPIAEKWEEIEPLCKEKIHHQMIPHEDHLWVIGGYEDLNIHKYDISLNQWCNSSIVKENKESVHFKLTPGNSVGVVSTLFS